VGAKVECRRGEMGQTRTNFLKSKNYMEEEEEK
jgi:hypothetical protein